MVLKCSTESPYLKKFTLISYSGWRPIENENLISSLPNFLMADLSYLSLLNPWVYILFLSALSTERELLIGEEFNNLCLQFELHWRTFQPTWSWPTRASLFILFKFNINMLKYTKIISICWSSCKVRPLCPSLWIHCPAFLTTLTSHPSDRKSTDLLRPLPQGRISGHSDRNFHRIPCFWEGFSDPTIYSSLSFPVGSPR